MAKSQSKSVKKPKPEPAVNNLPRVSEVTSTLHLLLVEYECHYPSPESAVLTMTKGLNTEQLSAVVSYGGVLSQDMVVRVICQNDHPDD